MTVAEFKSELETFLQGLRAHQAAWRNAQGWPLSNVKQQGLEAQGQQLARQLGGLRPIIHRFMPPQEWVMHQPATGIRWNALDAAVGSGDVAMVKGSSIQTVVDKLTQLLGRLDSMNQTDDLAKRASPGPIGTPPTPAKPLQLEPMSSSGPQGTVPDPSPAPSPPRVTSPTPPEEPVTLERTSVRRLVSALGNLSLGAALSIVGLLVTLVGITITVTRWVDQRSMDAMRDSVRVQQRVLDAERHRGDSLAAALKRRR